MPCAVEPCNTCCVGTERARPAAATARYVVCLVFASAPCDSVGAHHRPSKTPLSICSCSAAVPYLLFYFLVNHLSRLRVHTRARDLDHSLIQSSSCMVAPDRVGGAVLCRDPLHGCRHRTCLRTDHAPAVAPPVVGPDLRRCRQPRPPRTQPLQIWSLC